MLNNKRMQKISLLAAVIYTALMALGMYTLGHIVGDSYADPIMAKTLIYFEIIMTIFAVGMYLKYFKGKSFRKINRKPEKLFVFTFLVMIIIELIMLFILFFKTDFTGKDNSLLLLVFITTIFVGISEELIYRGIVLPAFLENYSACKAVLISSALFSLLHSVNILAGVSSGGMIIQLLLTFFVGITLASLFIEFQNLIPLMIFHALWDFLAIGGKVVDADFGFFEPFQVIFEIIMGFILLFMIIKKRK